jgi:hypothetical protein
MRNAFFFLWRHHDHDTSAGVTRKAARKTKVLHGGTVWVFVWLHFDDDTRGMQSAQHLSVYLSAFGFAATFQA